MNRFVQLLGLSAALPAFAQGYLCSEDVVTGFSFDRDTQQWVSANYRAAAQYLVAPSKSSTAQWEVRETGARIASAYCEQDFSALDLLRCHGVGNDFMFNRMSMRFLKTYVSGYWNEESLQVLNPKRLEGNDAPGMAIGRCTAL
jgi:hypothetical protein